MVLLVGCGGETPVGEETATETAVSTPTDAPILTPTAVATATPAPTATPLPTPTPDPLYTGSGDLPWWNDTVFYQIYVRSFKDSDGDGSGDLNGIIEMLDYLNDGDPATSSDLGVTGIWLMPITEAPAQHPHGYHVVDYYQVETDYGTNDDFRRLVDEAHRRGIRVIVDLVINHTAKEHPWFQEAMDPASDRRDWYVWADEDPGYRGPDGQQVWHRSGDNYYYGVFNGLIPDLNLENPDVTAAIYDVTRFWLEEMNADGFRLDAIKHFIEAGELQENSTASHEWLQAYHDYVKSIGENAFLVGEAWTAPFEIVKYTGDEVDIAFEFDLATGLLNAARSRANSPAFSQLERVVDDYPPGQYAPFLANHDQDRAITQLDGSEVKARLAATLLLTSPGVPFIYYGEEIGMGGRRDPTAAITEAPMRRPMQWAGDSIGVGFTDGVPWRAPADDYETRSVAQQDGDPDSLLNHYRALIHLRHAHDALRVGAWTPLTTNAIKVYAALRHTENEIILVLINLHNEPVTADEYSLELAEGPLSDDVKTTVLYGDGSPTAPTVNAAGGFDAYTPLETIPGQSQIIMSVISDQ